MKNKMSFLSGSLLWFGAAVSIAEIMTGTLIAPLGMGKGMLAIVLGHLIGCILMYFAGLIGAKTKSTSMETVGFSFGRNGSVLFSVLNVLQLVGWTSVMIIGGAKAFSSMGNAWGGTKIWCVVIGVLIAIWIIVGIKNIGKINIFAVGSLLVLTVILAKVIFTGDQSMASGDGLSFGMAMELSIAMPLSWLPLISDYTKNTDKPVAFTLSSTACYFVGSVFMYAIGIGGAIFMGSSDIVEILNGAGLGIVALIIVVLSTVTTTYLDVYSAGESMLNINKKLNGKVVAIVVCIIGTLIAMFVPIDKFESFLYLIGSVFVPMVTILITDYFILKKDAGEKKWNIYNLILWAFGFGVYRIFLNIDTVLGSTIPVIIIIAVLCVAVDFGKKMYNKKACVK